MNTLRALWHRLRLWHLNRWADQLKREAEYHKNQAKTHTAAAAMFWMRSNDVRALARRVKAAGGVA